jgi:[ribosomal protein S5]-alanine N-acetyltransferase
LIRSLETERLILKTLNKDSAPLVLAFYEDNKTFFEPWEPRRHVSFYTLAYQRAFLTAEHNQIQDGKLLRYWVFLKERPDELIGTVCFQNILREPYHSCSLGYKFSNQHLHQGYATESIQKCIELVFTEAHIHRIDAYIMPNNSPSIRLIERLGFQYEGTCLSFAKISGNWTDHMHYARINHFENVSPT